jgi:hypothetical protein
MLKLKRAIRATAAVCFLSAVPHTGDPILVLVVVVVVMVVLMLTGYVIFLIYGVLHNEVRFKIY